MSIVITYREKAYSLTLNGLIRVGAFARRWYRHGLDPETMEDFKLEAELGAHELAEGEPAYLIIEPWHAHDRKEHKLRLTTDMFTEYTTTIGVVK